MELRRRVEGIDRLRGDIGGVVGELDRLVMEIPAARMARGIRAVNVTTRLRRVAAQRRGLRPRWHHRSADLLACLQRRGDLIIGDRAMAREDAVAPGLHLLRRRRSTREDHGEGGAECEEEGAHAGRVDAGSNRSPTDAQPSGPQGLFPAMKH
jgi:hypothetical protein